MKRHHRSHHSHHSRHHNPDTLGGGFVEGMGIGIGLAIVAGVAHYWMRGKPMEDKKLQDVATAAQAMGHSAGVKLGADLQAAAMLAQTAAPAQLPASSSSAPAAPAASARAAAVPAAVVQSVSSPSLASASSPAAAGLYRTYGVRPSGILGGGVSSFVPAGI